MPEPIFRSVNSSTIQSVWHDPKRNTLLVKFKNGSVYEYANVTPAQHKAFLAAESAGGWLAENLVKKPQAHPATKLPGKKK